MNAENTDKLIAAFPLLYADCYAMPTQSNMAFGFECRDGWFQLIWGLSEKLELLIREWKASKSPHSPEHDEIWPRASQVKEKYGTLCFYMTCGTAEMWALIEEAEAQSETICEACGAPGTLNTKGWWSVTCGKEHAK